MQVEEYYEQIVSAPKPRRGVLGMLDVYKRQLLGSGIGALIAKGLRRVS